MIKSVYCCRYSKNIYCSDESIKCFCYTAYLGKENLINNSVNLNAVLKQFKQFQSNDCRFLMPNIYLKGIASCLDANILIMSFLVTVHFSV